MKTSPEKAKSLSDFLRRVPDDQILAQCQILYPEDAAAMLAASKRMRRMKPNTAAGYVIKPLVFVSEGESCHDFWCVSPSAPEFKPMVLPWTVWLGASVPGSVKRKYSPAEIAARGLRGMTGLGFTRAHIRRTLNRLWEDLVRQTLEAEAEGFQSTSLESFLGEAPAQGAEPKEPNMVITPGFQESLSHVPCEQQSKIKKAIKRLHHRTVR